MQLKLIQIPRWRIAQCEIPPSFSRYLLSTMMSLVLQRRLVRLPLHARVASARNYPRHINVTRVLAEEAKERKPSFIGSIGQRFGRLVETIHERSAQRQVVAVMISILMARKSDATVHEKIIPDPKLRGTMLKMGRKLLVEGNRALVYLQTLIDVL